MVLGLLHRSTGRTARFIDFVANQLIGLFVGRFLLNAHFAADQTVRRSCFIASYAGNSSALGSSCSRTKWAHFTARTSSATPETPRCSDIARDTRDSSLLGARTSPATPGTPRSSVLGHHQRRRGLLGPRSSNITSDARDSLAARILLRLVGVLSSCSMLFGSGC